VIGFTFSKDFWSRHFKNFKIFFRGFDTKHSTPLCEGSLNRLVASKTDLTRSRESRTKPLITSPDASTHFRPF